MDWSGAFSSFGPKAFWSITRIAQARHARVQPEWLDTAVCAPKIQWSNLGLIYMLSFKTKFLLVVVGSILKWYVELPISVHSSRLMISVWCSQGSAELSFLQTILPLFVALLQSCLIFLWNQKINVVKGFLLLPLESFFILSLLTWTGAEFLGAPPSQKKKKKHMPEIHWSVYLTQLYNLFSVPFTRTFNFFSPVNNMHLWFSDPLQLVQHQKIKAETRTNPF